MSYADNPYRSQAWGEIAADAAVDERMGFIRKTYGHLLGAICGFIVLEAILLKSGLAESILPLLMGKPTYWLVVLGLFVGVSYLANYWAQSSTSIGMQYAGLGLYVAAESIIFLPILYVAENSYPGTILAAGILTAAVFGGLTFVVFFTKHDFSYLRMALTIGSFAAIGLVVAAVFMQGINLGIWFSVAMIVLASGYILYDTSNVMHHYRIGQHVAASLALFASVALLFFYILRLVMALQSRD